MSFKACETSVNDTLIYGANGQSYEASKNGSYIVEVTNSNDCKSKSLPYYFVYTNIFNPALTQMVEIYPNPATGTIHFNTNFNDDLEIKVYNLLGDVVFQSQSSVNQFDLSNIPKGIYLIVIWTKGAYGIEKLVLQ